MKKVVRVDRSPMNPRVWVLELECGHDSYVTARKRPARQTNNCEKCERAAAEIRRLLALTEERHMLECDTDHEHKSETCCSCRATHDG